MADRKLQKGAIAVRCHFGDLRERPRATTEQITGSPLQETSVSSVSVAVTAGRLKLQR